MTERLKGFWKQIRETIWSQTSGKAALILLSMLVIIGVAAALALPPNFISIWNDPKYWGGKPKNVPPSWSSFFGYPCVQHFEEDLRTLAYKLNVTANEASLTYTFNYDYRGDGFPQGMALKLDGIYVNGVGNMRIEIHIARPDGVVVPDVISYLATGANGSISIENIILNPDTIKLASTLVMSYPQFLRVASMNDIAMNYPIYLFGKYSNSSKIAPLGGVYKVYVFVRISTLGSVTIDDVNKVVNALKSSKDFRFIIIGTCYGLLGTDYRGRDLAQALFFGLPIALLIGFGTAFLTTVIGLFAGLVSGYYGGFIDEFVQRFIDVLGSIPTLPILILIAVSVQQAYGASPYKPIIMLMVILFTLIVFGWGGLAIIVRSMTLSIKAEAYVEAAQAVGASNWWIMTKHIIPQLLPYIAAQMVYSAPSAILTEAGLSILGIQHGLPTWGGILSDARLYGNIGYWWWIFPPGIAISIVSLTFVLLGMSIERVVEPRLRGM
ncbi:MAG: ABC transporter permease [Ignisphaera sp.]